MSYRWMTLRQAERWEPLAKAWGVSKVARSRSGFMGNYRAAGGSVTRTKKRKVARSGDLTWGEKREGFISRHLAQMPASDSGWRYSKKTGLWYPTARHLALMMWAYKLPTKPEGKAWREGDPIPGRMR